jgi:hypothetical protein
MIKTVAFLMLHCLSKSEELIKIAMENDWGVRGREIIKEIYRICA